MSEKKGKTCTEKGMEMEMGSVSSHPDTQELQIKPLPCLSWGQTAASSPQNLPNSPQNQTSPRGKGTGTEEGTRRGRSCCPGARGGEAAELTRDGQLSSKIMDAKT